MQGLTISLALFTLLIWFPGYLKKVHPGYGDEVEKRYKYKRPNKLSPGRVSTGDVLHSIYGTDSTVDNLEAPDGR